MSTGSNCEECMYYEYDEEFEYYTCCMNLDEDEYANFLSNTRFVCPYYRFGDEYQIVKKQI